MNIKIKSYFLKIGLMLVTLVINNAHSQNKKLEQEYVKGVVNKIGDLFESNYVFPEKGIEVKTYLKSQFMNSKYDNYDVIDSLANKIKNDILEITKDKHVNLIVSKKKEDANEESQQDAMSNFFNSFDNFGLTKVGVLEGNIGLLEIQLFYPLGMNPEAREAAKGAMDKLKDCKSIIFDLRACKGGSPDMLNFLVTYLYPEGSKIHLNEFYYRPMDEYTNTYTLDSVPGKRLSDANVYVLTSNKTFSCGEEFAYDIKHLKRGKLIGETTGGAAHPVQPFVVDESLQVLVPFGRAINPITKTNWEGVGVIPDIKISEDKALEKALTLIKS
jgi:C-terminal processing protease CtpA/Prc